MQLAYCQMHRLHHIGFWCIITRAVLTPQIKRLYHTTSIGVLKDFMLHTDTRLVSRMLPGVAKRGGNER